MKKNLIVLVALLITTVSLAQTSPVFIKDSYAVAGYDVVAYFTENKAVKGSKEYPVQWKNATWLFSTQKHADMFKSNPEKYAPQYGGYCAYGCSRGYKAKTDAEAFTVKDGKLYFNYNLKTREEWLKDIKASIEKADENWKVIEMQ